MAIQQRGSGFSPRLHGPGLLTTEGRALTPVERHDVNTIAEGAMKSAQEHRDAAVEQIRESIEANRDDYADEARNEVRDSAAFTDAQNEALDGILTDRWNNLDDGDRLQLARDMEIAEAYDTEHFDAPDEAQATGRVGMMQYPNKKRVVDLSQNPLTMSSKGMVQEYDKSMVDIGHALGKPHGARPRKLEIQTMHRGALRIEKTTANNGSVNFKVMAGEGPGSEYIERFDSHTDKAEDIAQAEQRAEAKLRQLREDRTVWAMPLTSSLRDAAKKGYPLMSALPPAVGTYLWLKDGQRVRVTAAHDDGSFDAEPAPQKAGARR
jgi:hypothetical protein